MREFIEELSKTDESFKLTPTKWKIIQVIKDILHEPYTLTMALQRTNYTLSDFYGEWIKTKRNLAKIGHPLADSLLTHMERRERKVLNTKIMLAAVYLDPRYNMLLKSDQKQIAVGHLCQLWCRLTEISPTDTISSTANAPEDDDFAQLLNQATNATQNVHIVDRIRRFIDRPAINYKSNILEYWNKIKSEEPDLFKLQKLIFTVAVTQVDVERSFSSLNFIFNNYRSALNTDTLARILILRSNYDIFPHSSDFFTDTMNDNM